jgi:outer membrane protein TolC
MFVNKNSLGVLERMGETEAKLTVENTVAAIILGYYGIAQQEKLLLVLEDAAALSRERKAIMQARMDLGAGSELQLLQSTVDLNADSIALVRELSALEQSRADFNRLLARDPGTDFILTDSLALGDPLDYEKLVESSREQNTVLQLARYSLDIDRLNVKSLQAQRYPTLNLNAAYNYSLLTSETGFASYSRSFGPTIGFSLNYPLFDGFNVNRTIKNARIELNSGEMMLQGTDLAIRTEIYKLFTAYRANMKIVEIEQVNHRVAERNVEVAFEKYRLGALSDIELRETQKKYIESQYQLLVSQFLAKRAEIELLRSSGQLEMALK